jgi:hypothetical protein
MVSDAKKKKARALRRAVKNGTWYAACESGHPFWSGKDRDTYQKAQDDATAHDDKVHGGESTAVVLEG